MQVFAVKDNSHFGGCINYFIQGTYSAIAKSLELSLLCVWEQVFLYRCKAVTF